MRADVVFRARRGLRGALGMGNRATVYALHLEYSGANFATAEFPANGGLRERQKPLRRCSAVSNVTIAPLSTSHGGKKPDKNGVLKIFTK